MTLIFWSFLNETKIFLTFSVSLTIPDCITVPPPRTLTTYMFIKIDSWIWVQWKLDDSKNTVHKWTVIKPVEGIYFWRFQFCVVSPRQMDLDNVYRVSAGDLGGCVRGGCINSYRVRASEKGTPKDSADRHPCEGPFSLQAISLLFSFEGHWTELHFWNKQS